MKIQSGTFAVEYFLSLCLSLLLETGAEVEQYSKSNWNGCCVLVLRSSELMRSSNSAVVTYLESSAKRLAGVVRGRGRRMGGASRH